MCSTCDVEDNVPAAPAFLPEDLADAVRRVESEMLAEPLCEKMWAIFFGHESGSIPWATFESMRACHEAALALLAREAARQQPTYRIGRSRLRARARAIGVCSA